MLLGVKNVEWIGTSKGLRALKYTLALVVVFVSQIGRAELNAYREY